MWLERGSEHPVPWGKGGENPEWGAAGAAAAGAGGGAGGAPGGSDTVGKGRTPPKQRVLLHGGCFRTGNLGKSSLCGWQHALQLETAPPATAPWQSLGLGRCQGAGDMVVVAVVVMLAGAPAQPAAGWGWSWGGSVFWGICV